MTSSDFFLIKNVINEITYSTFKVNAKHLGDNVETHVVPFTNIEQKYVVQQIDSYRMWVKKFSESISKNLLVAWTIDTHSPKVGFELSVNFYIT